MDISINLALSIFGLNGKYSQSEISSAYRKLVKITHPDSGGDKNLFLFVNECKDLLEKNFQNPFFSSGVSKKEDTNQQSKRKIAYIELDLLYEEYDILEKYMEEFNINDIYSNMYISINPIFKKALTKWKNYTLKYPFISFLESKRKEIIFKETICIPKEFEKYKFFNVSIRIEEKKYNFFIFKNTFKEISSLNAFKECDNSNHFLTTLQLSFETSNY